MSLLSLLGIQTAFAASVAAPNAGESIMSVLPFIVLIILFMYFFTIRPQQKRAKEHRELVGKLAKGDEVVTTGGLLGVIDKISDDFVVLKIAEKVNVTLQKPSISGSVPKGTLKSIK